MTDLATVTDVADLLGLASEAVDPDQAAAMLAQASAKFRAEAQCQFTAGETTTVLRVDGQRVSLPARPVTAVSEVRQLNRDGSAGSAMTAWTFDGIHTIHLSDATVVINATYFQCETVQVTWSHGYATVPEDVRWAVAGMVARAISSPAPAGVSGETIGAYSYRTGATTASLALGMTDEEREIARNYRPAVVSMTSTAT